MASASIASSGLPASRTDALSVVALGLVSAFIGATPADGKNIAIVCTTLANIWAIVSSVLTLRDVIHNPHDIETHLWLFLVGLLILTVVTSTLTLISFTVKEAGGVMACAFFGGMIVVLTGFLFGLVQLLMTYTEGCDTESFADTAMCKHSTGYVVGIVVGVGVGGLVFGCLITMCSVSRSGGVVQNTWAVMKDESEEQEPHSFSGAILTRTSALTKACLLGIYWFLVDGDLTWDYTVNGYDTSWWVTGQWTKQGAAIANNFLNCLC